MINREEIEKTRSPRGLRLFVLNRIRKVNKIKNEQHKALQRSGIYKIFTDEIIPLSLAALKLYPNSYSVSPVIGNQGYDAIIKDNNGKIIDYIEITWPQDGKRKADDALKILKRGYGNIHLYPPGDDLNRLVSFILDTCQKKSQKDYSYCTLIIAVDFFPPFKEHYKLYFNKLEEIAYKIKSISFKAKKVFLLIMPFKKIYPIYV